MAYGLVNFNRAWSWYKSQMSKKHGGARYDWENLPIYGKLWAWKQGRQRAQDYYDRTGVDDYYGTHYQNGLLDSAIGALSSPLPGIRLPTMAKSLAKMYGAEVELNIAKYRHATQMARRYEQDRWFEYQRRKKYNDWL